MPRPSTIKIILPLAADLSDEWVRFDPQHQRLVKSKITWVHVGADGHWTAVGGFERSKPWDMTNQPGRPVSIGTNSFHPASLTMVPETLPSGRITYGWSDEVVEQSKRDLGLAPVEETAPSEAAEPEAVDAPEDPDMPPVVERPQRRPRPRTRTQAAEAASK